MKKKWLLPLAAAAVAVCTAVSGCADTAIGVIDVVACGKAGYGVIKHGVCADCILQVVNVHNAVVVKPCTATATPSATRICITTRRTVCIICSSQPAQTAKAL